MQKGGFVSIPLPSLDPKELVDIFFSNFASFVKKENKTRTPRERMNERVVRDLNITSNDKSDGAPQTSKAHDLTYVDSSNTTGVEDGSKENPYNTVEEGVSGAIRG